MSKAFKGFLLFTAIEIAGLAAWLAVDQVGLKQQAFAILVVTLAAEHYVSINVGAGRKPFGKLPPDKP